MIEIKNLTHSFGEKLLYKDINITINKNDKIGLVGLNGTGKSTLINILTGNILYESGQIVFPKNIKVGYLDQFVNINLNQTIEEYLKSAFSYLYKLEEEYNLIAQELETNHDSQDVLLLKLDNIFQKMIENDFYEIDTKISQVATGLGIVNYGLNTIVETLSGGQKMKVSLAKILLQNPDFLILDEPTNYLDESHIEWFVSYLNKYEGSALIVSHDIKFLDSVVNTIWSIENLGVKRYNGNYSSYLKQKELNDKTQERHNIKLEKEREKLEEYIAKNGVRTATARQAKSREKKLQKMEVVSKNASLPEPHFEFLYKPYSYSNLIVLRNVSTGYNQTAIMSGLNLTIQNGEKIRFAGFNGIGKSTLLKTICGELQPIFGTIEYFGSPDIAYFKQEIDFADFEQTPLKDVLLTFPDMRESQARSLLAKVGITAKHITEPLKTLSGGEQCRVKLAKLMKEPHTILVLDEATNHLDVKAKQNLAQAINNFKGTVLFVSHEQDFVDLIDNYREINIKDFAVNKK